MNQTAQTRASYRVETENEGPEKLGTPPMQVGFGTGVVELPLLLPSREAEELESAAHELGLTTAELVRRLVRCFLGQGSCQRRW